nr:reverse transcriptase domain-containing protein [Tanacetum cinerariifolium]
MEELCQPSLNGRAGPIAIQATNFGLKNDMIQQVQNSCQFHGLPDTFYNGLTLRHRDTINAAAGGTFMKGLPEECYDLIGNMTAHHNDWDTSAQRTTVGNTQNVYAAGAYQGSETLPGNTITNPEEDLKGITTRSGTAYPGPTIPTTSSPPVVERETEETKDTVHPTNNESTEDVQPQVFQSESLILNSEPVNSPIIEPVASPLVDRSISHPVGIAEDVFVKVAERALIDVFEGELTFHVGKEAITFNLDQTSRYSANYNDMTANRIDVIDMECEEYSQEVLGFFNVIASGNPTPYYDQIISTTSPTLTPFGNSDFLLKDILLLKAFLNDDPSLPPPNQGNCLPEVSKKLKICEAKSDKSSIDEPLEVELKDLPPHLEYAFLEGDDKLPVIIAKDLTVEEKTALITVLKSHKRAIAWKLSEIKGIDPGFCTHKILMEEDFEPVVQNQRRVNPKIHDVIKKKVLKLLDAGLIYPNSDSPWVSPVHCILKKGGFIAVENEENELIPTCLVTGWRVCINYCKLNEATRKDYFPLPFHGSNAREISGNQYYCFLDGFFGYFQIPIDPKIRRKPRSLAHTKCLLIAACLLGYAMHRSYFMVKEGIVLGHKISKERIEVNKSKVDVITKLPHPTTIKARPMTRLLEKDTPFLFSKECVEAFQTLKRKLTEDPILIAPDWDMPFELMYDASDFAIGAVLGQRQDKHFRPIHYASKTMTEAESNYTTTEKEMLAVVSVKSRKRYQSLFHNINHIICLRSYIPYPFHNFIIMSNTNNNMQTQTSNTLHNAIMEAGSKDRPPMLAPGNYVKWKSIIKRYIDTKPNHELIHYCLENPPFKLDWKDIEVPVFEGSPITTTARIHETYKNATQEIRDQLNDEAEAVQIILTGIDNDIYSTVDACLNACEMWKLIERLKQAYHPQNHPTHYTQNSSTRSQQVVTRNSGKAIVNSPQPIYDQEPSMVAEDDETSKDKEIDKLMALISLSFKKIYKPTNNNLQTSSNTSHAYQDNSPRINRSAGYENQRIGNVVGARENVGLSVVQKSGIQCYNCKEFGHVARECQKTKRAKDAAYHREKMPLCKQEETGIQLNAEQADWRDDTDDDELEDQELEAHYMYMAQLQEVSPDSADSGPIFDDEPLQKVLIEKLNGEIEDFKNKNKSLESSNNFFKEANNKLSEINNLLYADYKKSEAELTRRNSKEYASQMELEYAKVRGDLLSYKMDYHKSCTKYTETINALNQKISEMKDKLSAHQETISILLKQKEAQINVIFQKDQD